MKLADRIGIVTGAAKGMGREICLTLAREGAHLFWPRGRRRRFMRWPGRSRPWAARPWPSPRT